MLARTPQMRPRFPPLSCRSMCHPRSIMSTMSTTTRDDTAFPTRRSTGACEEDKDEDTVMTYAYVH